MLTALPPCPNCHEHELYRAPGQGLRCRECGWREESRAVEERVEYILDNRLQKCDTLEVAEYVNVPRQYLETERRQLLSRLAELNRVLGYPALLTGKERRRQK